MLGRFVKGLALLLLVVHVAKAADKKFGLGIVLGEPTGISAKYWLSGINALDFGLSWGLGYNRYGDRCWEDGYYRTHTGSCNERGFYYEDRNDRGGYGGLHLHADYLFHNFNVIRAATRFPIYYGPGVDLNFWRHADAEVGVRGVLGIAWMPRSAPVDVFFEIAPVLELIPGTYVNLDAGLGARFYF